MQRVVRPVPAAGVARPEDNTARTHGASCLRSRFLRNDTLQAAFLAATRRYACSWPSRGLSRDVDVHLLPLTAEPEASSAILPTEVAGQADFLLDAWQSRASRESGLHCRRAPLVGAGAPRLVIGQFWGWHADFGYQRARHLPPSASLEVRQRACAYYTAMRELMYPSHASSLKSVGLLMYASEPAAPATIANVERLLEQRASIDPADVMLVHLNLGTMLRDDAALDLPRWSRLKHWARKSLPARRIGQPAQRLRQAWWHSLLWQMTAGRGGVEHRRQKSRVCSSNASTDAAARDHDGAERASFLLLGGAPKLFRGLTLLELARRRLLRHGRWSAARFGFCTNRTARASWDAAPFDRDEQARLLADVPLVEWLCRQLPRVLDVSPDLKSQILPGQADDALWRGTRFSLTFESLMPDDPTAAMLFLTEKLTKPMLQKRAFVLLGPAAALVALRGLGFHTFSGQVDERYDLMLDGKARLRAALDEVERISNLPDSSWQRPDLAAAIAHNQRHLVCGGLYRVILSQAQTLLVMAMRQGKW